MEQFQFEKPDSIKRLIDCLKSADSHTFILSGGTDLTIKLRSSGTYSGRIIDMTGIDELRHIRTEGKLIRIGANVTFAEIGYSEIIEKHAACVGQAARLVGSQQIRNIARMAGNLANSSPRGDSIPALFALDAKIRTVDGAGVEKLRTVDELITGIGQNSLKRDEAIIELLIPIAGSNVRSAFGKCGRESSRTTVVISNVNAAAAVSYDKSSGIVERASVVIGSAAPVPYHAVKAEEALRGETSSAKLGKRFAELLREHVKESINGVKRYENKLDEITGIGLDIYDRLFCDVLSGGDCR